MTEKDQETVELFLAIKAACREARKRQPDVFRSILVVPDVRDAPKEVETFWMVDTSAGEPAIDHTFFMTEEALDATAGVFNTAIQAYQSLRDEVARLMQQLLQLRQKLTNDEQDQVTRPEA